MGAGVFCAGLHIWWKEGFGALDMVFGGPPNARLRACKYSTCQEALKIKDFAVIKCLKKA